MHLCIFFNKMTMAKYNKQSRYTYKCKLNFYFMIISPHKARQAFATAFQSKFMMLKKHGLG